ncbi:MAG: hypothetical protein LBH66_09480 [Oscillospiraceae bacterium]|nr:hypothetical protein [Oscillospiraceae bacterium]
MDERLEERFLKPAISPEAAVDFSSGATESAADKAERIGMTPALSRVDTPAEDQPADPSKRLSGTLRSHLRQSAAASDKMRGVNIRWQTGDIPKEPPVRVIPGGLNPGGTATSARIPTYIKGRSGETTARGLRAPMDRVLSGTVRRMIQQDASYRRAITPLPRESGDDAPALTEKLPPIDPNANATARITGYLQQLARDSFDPQQPDQPPDISADSFDPNLHGAIASEPSRVEISGEITEE